MALYFAFTGKMRQRQQVMFGSLLLCCLSASLLSAAFGTEYWFESDSRWDFGEISGSVNFGLFEGMNYFNVNQYRTHQLYVVCLENKCMYSCANSKEYREEQMQMLLNGETENLKLHCHNDNSRQPVMMVDLAKTQIRRDSDDMRKSIFSPASSSEAVMVFTPYESEGEDDVGDAADSQRIDTNFPSSPSSTSSPGNDPNDLQFMDYGLWVGTIACLSAGLLMAVVGALFAIVNTATTPIEAITGVPGLYLWNGLAALFDIVTVILWAVQFHKHLSSNVLLYDSSDGWSTEGLEVFGYSFWLVVVAVVVHVANIIIIAIGTYEPKKKSQLQAPETKDGIILLY